MKSLVHACKFLLGLEAPFTQVTDRELDCLLRHSRTAAVVVEIGCYEGKTTAALARHTSGSVYSIDPFFRGRLGICYGEWIARIHCRRQRLNNVQFVKGFSYDVAQDFRDAIDFLFIDADHSYEAIKRDWEDWFPKVKTGGGVIALHDTRRAENSPDYFGSMKFYENDLKTMTGIREVDGIDSLAVFKHDR